MKKIYLYILLLGGIALSSCLNQSTTTVTVSSDATIASFSFSKNDSFPNLHNTIFDIVEGTDTGLITNYDSIAFGTLVNKVVPVLSFNSTPESATIYTPTDTIQLSVSDTIDFSHNPTLLHVMASDNIHEKWYKIFVNVHQMDPYLFNWSCLSRAIYPTEGTEQKAFMLNNEFFVVVNNGFTNSLYHSTKGYTWKTFAINGLPASCQVRNITAIDNTLYYADGKNIYSSTTGTDWTLQQSTIDVRNLLFQFTDSIWGIVEKDEQLCLATSKNALDWHIQNELPSDFPVSEYSALTFTSTTDRPRAMVVGGFSATGNSLNTRWNLEKEPTGEYIWTNFSIEHPTFTTLTGASIVWYNKTFYLFGGANAYNEITTPMLESIDEGMHWFVPDSAHNVLPETFRPRTKASVLIGSDNAIYIIGGQSRTEIYSDIYRGKLNSIDW